MDRVTGQAPEGLRPSGFLPAGGDHNGPPPPPPSTRRTRSTRSYGTPSTRKPPPTKWPYVLIDI